MNLHRSAEVCPFFIKFVDGRRRSVALELGAYGCNAGGFAFGKVQFFQEVYVVTEKCTRSLR